MVQHKTVYLSTLPDHGFFAEIYFPRKSAHQGTIFTALRDGYKENEVKTYLKQNVSKLLEEFKKYPQLLDPHQYDNKGRISYTKEKALERIKLYTSPFKGWSLYQIDGVFFDKQGRAYEEATQVVRIMFCFQSSYYDMAKKKKCLDILRAIIFWAITKQDLLDEHNLWDKKQYDEFFERHKPWPKRKLEFTNKYFTLITKEIQKWLDDCVLFIFGYLVGQFSESVLRENLPEEEIWVSSFFNLTVNVVKKVKLK